MPIRILSDFDGVWTDQGPEAQHILEFAAREIARCAGLDVAETLTRFEALADETRERPTQFGWAPQGRISAFVDEDPLLATNSVLHLIEDDTREELVSWKAALEAAGFSSLSDFANHCFNTSSKAFRESHPPIMVEQTRETFEAIIAAGLEICVVSNSKASKVVPWLREMGVDAGAGEGHAVRVYGDARKWQLSEEPRALQISSRTIYIDRPAYLGVLQEVRPDIIIGDVFSLDLALPHHLRTRGEAGGPRLLALRRNSHTPQWVTDGKADGAIDVIVDHPRDLLSLAASLTN
jgi:hypothetical protein